MFATKEEAIRELGGVFDADEVAIIAGLLCREQWGQVHIHPFGGLEPALRATFSVQFRRCAINRVFAVNPSLKVASIVQTLLVSCFAFGLVNAQERSYAYVVVHVENMQDDDVDARSVRVEKFPLQACAKPSQAR
jgi:hypothetical protein